MTTLNRNISFGATTLAEEREDSTEFLTNQGVIRSSTAGAGSRSRVGMLFTNITIPAGSTIDSCAVGIASQGGVGDVFAGIHFNDVDDAADFATEADVNSRPITTASTFWNQANLPSSPATDSPSIVTALQEIIDRPGWASGNAVMVIFNGDASQNLVCAIETTATSTLKITFTEPPPPAGGAGSQQVALSSVVPIVPL